ncbi:MAG: circularly permuted type 2 ATP-grasp protein [Alphaproteobacteria bacterium]|nr:circularly permuted type 2 ATP-grasp protein [Alphaproteobacteria bacterium SS10]
MSNQAQLPFILSTGAAKATGYDEAFLPDGRPRGHWAALMAQYQMLSASGLQERVERARQLAADAGISLGYHSGDPAGQEWLFDLLPLIIPADEWQYIEAAVGQRARVLSHLLDDLYGPQETLNQGIFPPYLVFGNPDYLRPVRVAGDKKPGSHLQVYAADLVRRPDGTWTIVADRTQVPTGAGFALANRRILARTLPEVFTNQAVRSCRQFFDGWAASLRGAAKANGANSPRMALLTPGPFAPGYFEHVYLAREMDLTLVEGADLTIRGDRLLLKELGGLQPIDLLLRRLDGDYCDPLELRPESLLGVSGLAQLQRAGRVMMANPIGSGAVQTPALFPFLPRLTQELLDETQKAASAETWWCGQPEILRQVIERLDDYIILPAFYGQGYPVDPLELSPLNRAALIDKMRHSPENYVAQERLIPSNAPMLSGASLQSHPVVLRIFAVADDEGNFQVMPGGFARMPVGGSPFSGILADGSITKDVWVLSDAETETVSYPLPITIKSVEIVRSTGGLQSRVADNLFWLGRHMARIEGSLRLCRTVYSRLLNATDGSREMAEINQLETAFWRHGLVKWEKKITPEQRGVLPKTLLTATSADGPISNDFKQANRLMLGLRDRCSNDMWDILSHLTGPLHDRLQHAAGDIDLSLSVFDELLHNTTAFAGLAAEGMVRGTAWRFLDFGRRLETALFGLRVAAACCGTGLEPERMHLRLALELGDALITYRSRYLSLVQPRPVLDLILTDETNPKAVLFQIERMIEHAGAFPYRRSINPAAKLKQIRDDLDQAVTLFAGLEPGNALSPDPAGGDLSLHLDRFLFEAERELHAVAGELSSAFFLHREGERLLDADWRPDSPVRGEGDQS